MPYVPTTNTRICLHTFKDEKDLPKGQKLLMCGRCKEACYVDREAQLANHRLHKSVCCAIDDADERLREPFETVDECFQVLGDILTAPLERLNRTNSRLLVYCFQQLEEFSSQDPTLFFSGNQEIKEFIARNIVCLFYNRSVSNDAFDLMWAVPGMANYFLSEERFLSTVMKERKRNGLEPMTEALQKLPKPLTFLDDQKVLKSEEECPGTHIIPLFGSMIQRFLKNSGFRHNHTGLVLRNPMRSGAIVRRVLRSFSCPYSRLSYPSFSRWYGIADKHAPMFVMRKDLVCDLITTALREREWNDFRARKEEVIPGLTMNELLNTLIDSPEYFLHNDKFTKIFKGIILLQQDNLKEGPLQYLTIDERLGLLDRCFRGEVHNFPDQETGKGLADTLPYFVPGDHMKERIKLYHRMLEKALSLSPQTISFVKADRELALIYSMPRLAAFVETVQERCRRKHQEILDLPEEVRIIICEYILPETLQEVLSDPNVQREVLTVNS